jgi:hypothetical protein
MDALDLWRGHCFLLSGWGQYGHATATGAALRTGHRHFERMVDFRVAQTIHHCIINYEMLMATPRRAMAN